MTTWKFSGGGEVSFVLCCVVWCGVVLLGIGRLVLGVGGLTSVLSDVGGSFI